MNVKEKEAILKINPKYQEANKKISSFYPKDE